MIDGIIHILSIVIIIVLIGDGFLQRKKKRKALEMYVDAAIDLETLKLEYEKIFRELGDQKLEKNDGFVKFISDSREWAFKYIEEVQQALDNFDKEVSPILEYYTTYGTSVDGLHIEITDQISKAYAELKKVLPSK